MSLVSPGCYGIPEQIDHIRDNGSELSSFTTVPWFCDACKAGMTSALCVGCVRSAVWSVYALCIII